MKIVIIDTKCSNLFSVKTILKRLGCNPKITNNPDIILKANKLFLPGVGTAFTAMQQLEKTNLVQLIKNCTQPILGICLGMQLFGSISEENDNIKTLGIINTPVIRIKYKKLSVPHMGWNNIIFLKKHPLFHGIKNNHFFYFAHSYIMKLTQSTIAYTKYGELFSAAIAYKNFLGVQFHPEKSSAPGKQLLKNFLEM
ncbi:imidazole glycerol phosphate synthase, glutamine amidotransferase subunit [Candidatus Blochmanniella vafra str. BVAF]|uniref:Imidazole glycerol phosphate synthase subunit HisH n=2 Tax=Candidatus Blochmanniella vafra TaxID=251535 RepID=E8Q729_BLOVB|nr:imidazole glycerol phosphate synthase subunit HisH [Candidatus Blochmannia vafer]ADA82639.1 imidazole glycerol phosphate synthase HisH subunit [Candidatus Blochmannia vafer]ADV33853.1 imidazole glycerol phosphate synthase, glutamine amidotransferase subunit [Candidatus Blochmannia vafer str. BVAF]